MLLPPCQCDLSNYHPYKYNLDCPKTWALLSSGYTLGVFQLESRAGQELVRKLKPENLEHLSALLAIARPGCLESVFDDKNITRHYIDRKNGLEAPTAFHPALKEILGDTYNVLIYQEQALAIAHKLAGFSLAKADDLRKAIGKKKADLMLKLEEEFLAGCRQVGTLDDEAAKEVFGWIKKSQRYSFNKSHSILYSLNTYASAYAKAHFPLEFYKETLSLAKYHVEKYDRISLLIDEAKLFGINICLPSLTNNFIDFTIHNGCIHFGIGNIKEVGESAVNKIKELKFELEQSLRKPIAECGWTNILIYLLCNLPKNVVIALIEAGALDFTGLSRTEMLFEYNVAYSLTIRELDLIKRFGDLDQHLSVYLDKLLLQPKIGSQRRKIIDSLQVSLVNSPHSLEDTLEWKNRAEKNRLGHIISSLDVSNKRGSEQANVTCLEFLQNNAYNQNLIFAVKIVKYKEYTSKKGNYMVFVTIKDETGQIDGIIFEKLWQKVKDENIIVEDNDVLVFGYRSPKNPKTVVVTQLVQLI